MSNLYVGADQTYTTIKAALQAAQDGDTIIVSAGDYTAEGEIMITKELILKAAEGATVVVDHVVLGKEGNDRIGDPYEYMTISGITMKPTYFNSGDWQCSGVWQNSFHINTVSIENCTIDLSNSPEKSIGIKCNRGGGYVKNINITGNTIIATGESANFGITIGTQSGIENITVTDNTVTGSFSSTGIHMDLGFKTAETYTVNVSGNTVEAETGRGIYIAGINNSDASVTVSGNNVSALSSAAAAALQLAGPAVESVVVSDNDILSAGITAVKMDSLTLGDAAVTVTGNDILAADPANGFVGYTPAADSNNTVSIIPTDSAVDKIFVNNAWAELEAGAKVLVDGSYRVIGTNAFADVNAARDAAVKADSTVVITKGTVANAKALWMNNTVEDGYDKVVGKENGFDVEVDGTLVGTQLMFSSGNLTVSKTGKIETNGDDKNLRIFDSAVTITGNRKGADDNIAQDEILVQGGWGGTFDTTAYNDKIQAVAGLLKVDAGSTVNVNDSFFLIDCGWFEVGQYWSMVNTDRAASTVTFNNSQLMFGNRGGYGSNTVIVDNGSTLSFVNGSVVETGDGHPVNITINAGSALAIANSKLAANTLTNNGSVTVSGESTLKIGALTGNIITALDGAVIKDSVIKSSGSVELVVGETGVASTVTFKGANDIAKISVGNGDKIVVGEDASLVLSGARSGFGNGATWDIDGNIENVKALSAEEKAGLTASLNLVGGLSVTGGGDSLFTVDNAYFTFGGSAITTKNTNQSGGKLTMSFTNSYVKSDKKISINPTASGYDAALAPEVELNFKDSVVELNNFFINNHAKSTVTIENTNFTATAFGNAGVVSVSAGSVVNFSMVNNALNDWVEKGGLNAGSITIDASDLNIANKGATVEFYNVGTIVLTNGATLTLDKLVNAAANELTGNGKINQVFADMVGSITIDASSTLTAGILAGSGTITIDAEGFVGTKTLVDVNSSTFSGEINVINNNGGARVYCAEDGDIILSAADMSIISVDSAWAGIATGTEIGEGSGKYMGINAFADVSEAMAAVAEENTVVEIADGSILTGETGVFAAEWNGNDAGEVALFDIAGKEITWSAEEAATLKFDARYVVLHGEGTLNIDQNINIDYEPGASGIAEPLFAVGSFWTNDKSTAKPTVNLNGKISAGDLVASVKVRHGNMYVSQTGAIDAQYGIRVRDGLLDVTGTGKDAAEAQLKSQRLEVSGDSVTEGAAKIILKDTYASITYGSSRIADRFDGNTDGYGYTKGFEFINSRVATGTLQFFDTVSTLKATDTDFTVTTVSNKGIMDFADSTLSISKNFTNDGSMSFADTSITVGGAVTNTGTLNFTFAAAPTIAKDGLLLIDAAKASSYGTVTLNGLDAKYEAVTIGEDLYAFDMSTVYVDAAYSTYAAGAKIADGIFMGINAFSSLEDLNNSIYSAGVRTVKYVAEKSGSLTLTVDCQTYCAYTINDGTAIRMTGSKDSVLAVEAGDVITLDFTQANGDFEISGIIAEKNSAIESEFVDGSFEDKGVVSTGTGAQIYNITVEAGTIGNYEFQISNLTGSVKYELRDEAGIVYKSGFSNSAVGGSVELGAGEYQLVISSVTSDRNVAFALNSSMEVSVISDGANKVSDADDLYTSAVSWDAVIGGEAYENWVGKGDTVDWITFTAPKAGRRAFTYTTDGDRVSFELYDSSMKSVTTFATNGSGSKAVRLEAGVEYYLKVTTAQTDATYTVAITA